MKRIRCELLELVEVPLSKRGKYYRAKIKRLSDHPKLGKPNDKLTLTSIIKSIDFENGILITINNTYDFGGE